MPKCNVKLVCDPPELIVFIAGPIPGAPEDNDCVVTAWPENSIETNNGVKIIPLNCGERYCLKYYLEDDRYADYYGEFALYCDDAETTFKRLPVNFTPDGRANGQECFTVECEEV